MVERETIKYSNTELIPDEEEIGSLREGWQFGSSKFINSTKVVTYFSKGNGAILISELQRNGSIFRNILAKIRFLIISKKMFFQGR